MEKAADTSRRDIIASSYTMYRIIPTIPTLS